ncbi:unnamed protein product, partial [Staurois parvus]
CAESLGHSGSPIHGKSRRCRLSHVISCVQSQLITDHQSTDDQCALMICVAPAVPPICVHQCQCHSALCQCHINATYQCLPVHISAHLSCLSVSPIRVPVSATYQCQSCQSVPVSAAYQCPSVPPIS